jgi:hypothetical protein
MNENDPRWSAAAWALFAIGLVGLVLLVLGLLIAVGVDP